MYHPQFPVAPGPASNGERAGGKGGGAAAAAASKAKAKSSADQKDQKQKNAASDEQLKRSVSAIIGKLTLEKIDSLVESVVQLKMETGTSSLTLTACLVCRLPPLVLLRGVTCVVGCMSS